MTMIRIYVSTFLESSPRLNQRCARSVTRSPPATKRISSAATGGPTLSPQQELHKGIQEGLLNDKNGSVHAASSSTSTAVTVVELERKHRTQQATINALCSFMVVLLAAQSLKSGTAKKKAELHLTAALEVLTETQEKLKQVTDPVHLHRIAHACAEKLEGAKMDDAVERTENSPSLWSAWFGKALSTRLANGGEDLTSPTFQWQTRIIAMELQHQICDLVGDAGLSQAERDQRYVKDLIGNLTDPDTEMIFEQQVDDSNLVDLVVTTLQEDDAFMDTTANDPSPVAKKRLFSM